MAIKGKVYDVTGKPMYQPGGSYHGMSPGRRIERHMSLGFMDITVSSMLLTSLQFSPARMHLVPLARPPPNQRTPGPNGRIWMRRRSRPSMTGSPSSPRGTMLWVSLLEPPTWSNRMEQRKENENYYIPSDSVRD